MKRLIWLISSLLLSQSAIAASAKGNDIVPPEAIYKVNPAHPKNLLEKGQDGEAVIVATVDMFGSVKNPSVESATDDEFGLAAMLAASEWIFEPANRGGVPIEVRVKLPFKFHLSFEHQVNVQTGRSVFIKINEPILQSADLEISPTPKYIPAFSDFYPERLKGTGEKASVSVQFVIGPDGTVHNPHIASISNPDFRAAAIRAVSRMKYNPIRHKGMPAYVWMKRPFQMSE